MRSHNYTPRVQQAFAFSREEAAALRHCFIGTEHLLLGLLRLGNGVAVAVLRSRGVDLDAVRKSVVELVGYGLEETGVEKPRKKWWFWFGWRSVEPTIPFTPRSKRVCALAAKEAKVLNHSYVGTEHLLLGLVAEGEGVAARVLASFGIDAGSLRDEILKQLDPDYRQPIHETEAVRLGEEDCPMIVVGLDRARAIAAARVVRSVGGKFEHVMSARREILAELAPCNPEEVVFHFVPLGVGDEEGRRNARKEIWQGKIS